MVIGRQVKDFDSMLRLSARTSQRSSKHATTSSLPYLPQPRSGSSTMLDGVNAAKTNGGPFETTLTHQMEILLYMERID